MSPGDPADRWSSPERKVPRDVVRIPRLRRRTSSESLRGHGVARQRDNCHFRRSGPFPTLDIAIKRGWPMSELIHALLEREGISFALEDSSKLVAGFES